MASKDSADASTTTDVDQLAYDYLFKEVSDVEGSAIRDQIRALTATQAELLHDRILDLNGYSGIQRQLADAFFERTQARGVAFFDLTRTEQREAIAEVVGIPIEAVPLAP